MPLRAIRNRQYSQFPRGINRPVEYALHSKAWWPMNLPHCDSHAEHNLARCLSYVVHCNCSQT